MSAAADDAARWWAARRARHPPLRAALRADLEVTARFRGEALELASTRGALVQGVRMALVSDAYLAQALYRTKAALQARGVPVLPRLAHRLAMAVAQVSIGDPVIVAAGVYVVHGQVVIDGIVEIGAGTVIAPWVTIGLRAGDLVGATIGERVSIGTGAKVIGPVSIGDDASVGANAVVLEDVPAGATVVGAPAREVRSPAGSR